LYFVKLRARVAQSVHRLDDWGSVPSRGNDGILLFATAFKPALGPIQPPLQQVPGALTSGEGGSCRGVKVTSHLHLILRSRMRGAIPPLPNTSKWRDA